MILNETINIPENYFGVSFQDVKILFVNESSHETEDVAIVRLLKDDEYLGQEFQFPIGLTVDEDENIPIEEQIINNVKDVINNVKVLINNNV